MTRSKVLNFDNDTVSGLALSMERDRNAIEVCLRTWLEKHGEKVMP